MGTLTYFKDNGSAAVYNLIAARSVAERENAPKTLEQIIAEVEADPNPFPPLTLELVLWIIVPLFLLWLLIRFIRKLLKRIHKRETRLPGRKSRYLK